MKQRGSPIDQIAGPLTKSDLPCWVIDGAVCMQNDQTDPALAKNSLNISRDIREAMNTLATAS